MVSLYKNVTYSLIDDDCVRYSAFGAISPRTSSLPISCILVMERDCIGRGTLRIGVRIERSVTTRTCASVIM